MKGNNKKRVLKIIKLLKKEYSDARIALRHSNNLEILIATILSAQCTDRQVNIVTNRLFKKYRNAEDFANVNIKELEKNIKSTGFYKDKAKNIKKSCQILVENYKSRVPKSMDELLKLPGVGRKTANIVLSHGFGIAKGIAVDTHVKRLSRRLGLTDHNEPNKIEKDLMKIVPKSQWIAISDLLIFHGRKVCIARKPMCEICILKELCPSAKIRKKMI